MLVSPKQVLCTHVSMAGSRSGLLIQLKQKRKDFSSQQLELRSQVCLQLAHIGHGLMGFETEAGTAEPEQSVGEGLLSHQGC